jgi:hypothetical protein
MEHQLTINTILNNNECDNLDDKLPDIEEMLFEMLENANKQIAESKFTSVWKEYLYTQESKLLTKLLNDKSVYKSTKYDEFYTDGYVDNVDDDDELIEINREYLIIK